MYEHRLRTVHAPPRPPALTLSGEGEQAWSPGDHTYLCGTCGRVLVRDVDPSAIEGALIPCSLCGAWNALVSEAERDCSEGSSEIHEVVVVDDEPDLLDLVCEVLNLEGFKTVCLDTPQAAQRMAPTAQPDLFLLDMMLPGMSGIELARTLQTEKQIATPMVAISASSLMLECARDSNLFVDTLPKPFDLSSLIAVVHRHVA